LVEDEPSLSNDLSVRLLPQFQGVIQVMSTHISITPKQNSPDLDSR